MKILALSGSNAANSFNLRLLKFVTQRYAKQADFTLMSVRGLPMFKEGQTASKDILTLAQKIQAADLLLIASPEQQHSVASSLKSALEWLSSVAHPFKGKAVALLTTSPLPQGASRCQARLKNILAAPGFGCIVFDGDEFTMGTAEQQFDQKGNLINQGTIKFMDKFMNEVKAWYRQISK